MHKNLKHFGQFNLWITPVWWGITDLDNDEMYKKISDPWDLLKKNKNFHFLKKNKLKYFYF